ncbi:hypothetical protein [Roseitranquillus sediminis]|uniref:hypothetical protein n=1 Tax=Roseitranquillus sediminis TaxID=2809051 RepID=UPI001D0CC0B6|nr:hypothetical protein [Roseitranquillus sediminis]MBM9594998.1 hypothetical protein [Roseitranquillus sediminis]
MNRPRAAVVAALVAGGVFLLLVGFLAGSLVSGVGYGRFAFLYENFTIDACLAQFGSGSATVEEVQALVRACYEKLRLQGTLNDFLIRRVNFQTQHFADTVVMWMVVLMTMSGVALAGYQIVAASRLAPGDTPAESEVSVERGRLFLRSSVTGLFILIVSFAFFYVYVIYVYTIYEIDSSTPAVEVRDEPIGPQLPVEGEIIE